MGYHDSHTAMKVAFITFIKVDLEGIEFEPETVVFDA